MSAQAESYHAGVDFAERLRRAKERLGVERANRECEQVAASEKLARRRKEERDDAGRGSEAPTGGD